MVLIGFFIFLFIGKYNFKVFRNLDSQGIEAYEDFGLQSWYMVRKSQIVIFYDLNFI